MTNHFSLVYATTISKPSSHYNYDNLYLNGKYMSDIERNDNFHYSRINQEQIQIYAVYQDIVKDGTSSVSSEIVIRYLKLLHSQLREENELTIERTKYLIRKFISHTNEEINNYKKSVSLLQLGTTFAGLFIVGTKGIIVNIGLSESTILKKEAFIQKIVVDNQSKQSIENPPEIMNKVKSYLGVDENNQLEVQFSEVLDIQPGDIYILSTRGVTPFLSQGYLDELIVNTNNNEVLICKKLIEQLSREYDSTVMVVNIDDLIEQHPLEKDTTSYFDDDVIDIESEKSINHELVARESKDAQKNKSSSFKKSILGLILIVLIIGITMLAKQNVSMDSMKTLWFEYYEIVQDLINQDEADKLDDIVEVDMTNQIVIEKGSLPKESKIQENTLNQIDNNNVLKESKIIQEVVIQEDVIEENKDTLSTVENDMTVNVSNSQENLIHYTVMEGDYLIKIAKHFYSEYNVSKMVLIIKHLNEIPEDSDVINAGQILILPKLINHQVQYRVKKGDTVYSIALNLFQDTSMINKIMIANKIKDSKELKSGEIIVLPLE